MSQVRAPCGELLWQMVPHERFRSDAGAGTAAHSSHERVEMEVPPRSAAAFPRALPPAEDVVGDEVPGVRARLGLRGCAGGKNGPTDASGNHADNLGRVHARLVVVVEVIAFEGALVFVPG